ncbi:hypothetical protein Q8F55_002500 [Vanrija albida]|uniref:Invertebrate defensins family profile domain-containing protein n=1 Tax=Vanrija albida TaxID=181172 RepID=A0ABR3QA20_9TREE
MKVFALAPLFFALAALASPAPVDDCDLAERDATPEPVLVTEDLDLAARDAELVDRACMYPSKCAANWAYYGGCEKYCAKYKYKYAGQSYAGCPKGWYRCCCK